MGAEKAKKPSIIACRYCCEMMERMSPNHKYHKECFAKNRAKGPSVIGIASLQCLDCDVDFVRGHPNQKYCASCSLQRNTRGIPTGKKMAVCHSCGNEFVGDKRTDKCRECSVVARKEYGKRWRAENKEKLKADKRRYEIVNSERVRDMKRKYRQENPEKKREWASRKRRDDPQFRLRYAMSNGIGTSLKGAKGGRSWEALVGYSLPVLKKHLERQFTRGMNWENYGEWHVDHIVPDSSFSYSSADDPGFIASWALTNLRPLWAGENVKKSAKRIFLI